mmetsp:Transcript_27894/g.70116  ORF Transcript_27894/g.70116 Transcript_27894/m.70116 type:complete len:234 (+) Transcript_27894:758-1459(+)
MVVLRLMRRVKTPPMVSMPRLRGVTSSSRMSFTSPRSTPPWMAAPMATTSSGLTPLLASLLKISLTMPCTLGMRVMPPTSSTSLMSLGLTPASFMQSRQGCLVRSSRESTRLSNLERVMVELRCLAPEASAVMNGRLTSVCAVEDSSHLAFSLASRRRCTASLSPLRSMPDSCLNSLVRCCSSVLSKSSPPRKVSPLVALTSNTPPLISRMDTSKVPPPRSYTATRPSFWSAP